MAASSRRSCAETRLSSTTSRRCSVPDSPAPPQRGHRAGAALRPGPRALRSSREPAGRAERHRPDRRVVWPQVDGVDEDLKTPRVERRAGGELAQRVRRRAQEARRLRAELLGLRVDPGHRHVERDHVVEQRVVGQDPELLQDRDPVLALQALQLVPRHDQGRAGGAQGALVVVAGRRERVDALQLRQRLLDRGPPVVEPLDGRHPALDASYRCAARPLVLGSPSAGVAQAAQARRRTIRPGRRSCRGTGPGDRRRPSSAKPISSPRKLPGSAEPRAHRAPGGDAAGPPRGRSSRRGGRRTAAAGSPRRTGTWRARGPAR